MIRVQEVLPETIADELELPVGSRIVRINGDPVRDAIDFHFMEVDAFLELELAPASGEDAVVYEIDKGLGESLGVVPAPDTVRECANECVFCFIDGNPPGMRDALSVRDDDFRLSFTYGSYVTLTNLGPRGIQRLIDQRLSPLYVSVHATEPEVRERLLGVPRGGDIVERLDRLTSAGLEVHTQIVLCPGWNDGEHLERTIEDLWALGPGVLSLSVVPVGLTRYNVNRPVRLLEPDEAGRAIDQVDRARGRARAERGTGWAYIADEMFFIADRPAPPAEYYDDWPLTENGVGAARRFLDEFEQNVSEVPDRSGLEVAVVTGTRMAGVIEPLLPALERESGADIELVEVENTLYGETVNTAGLLPGRDILRELRARGRFDGVLLPAEALNQDERFIDNIALEDLAAELRGARVVPGHELTAALAEL